MRICAVQNIEAMFLKVCLLLVWQKVSCLYVQLVRNSVKEGKGMENDFLNTTKSNVNLKSYINMNLFYNYEITYSISLTESQQGIMFLIQSS